MNKKDKKKNTKKGKKKIFKRVILTLFLIGFLLALAGVGAFMAIFFSDKFAMSKEDLTINYTNTFVYDSEGNLLKELTGEENRKIINLSEMPKNLPNAFVAIEDERFYDHHGVDFKRTLAATVTYITHRGSSSFGGSSITQQLIKNITNEKDDEGTAGIQRKIKEMSRAYQVEKILSKDDILELYLNIIYLGGYAQGENICGVEVGSEYYFAKSAKDLTLAECAFLAGINHSPNYYNPFVEEDNSQKIKNRTETVLDKMKELKFITEEEYDEAIKEVESGLPFQHGNTSSGAVVSYHIAAALDQVINQLMDEKGMSYEYAKSRLYGGGYKLYTTQVSSIQNRMDEEFKKDRYIIDSDEYEGQHTQAAMVIMDYRTGNVVGCMGGLGTDVNAIGLNRINIPKQPGSSIKPIASIAPALESNIITAATVYDDSPTLFGSYTPRNSTGYQGLCNIRKVIEVSANVVEVKIMSELTPENSIKFLKQMGLDHISETEDANLAMVLGGLTYGATPLEMAGAYSTIANGGEYITPTFYTKLVDKNGEIALTPNQERRRVFSEGNSYIAKSILKSPVEGYSGTATDCKISGMEVGAKTGTTDDNFDRWLCGITPYYVGATWFGYDKNETIPYSVGNPAKTLWIQIMKDIHEDLEAKDFDKPDNIVTARICRNTGKSATRSCTNTYTEEFVAGTVPEACDGHKHEKICKESGKIATEFCKEVEEKTFTIMPDKEKDATWRTNVGDKYSTITETCDIHTKPEENKNEVKEDPNNKKPETVQLDENNVKVPDLLGLTEEAAKQLLTVYGLKSSVITGENSASPDGVVINQNRKSTEIVPKNTVITITINKKKEVKPVEEKPTENKPVENKTTDNNNAVSTNSEEKNTTSSNVEKTNTGNNIETKNNE